MDISFSSLQNYSGHYVGEGVNHSGDKFFGYLELKPLFDGRSFELCFSASGLKSENYHSEKTIIGLNENEIPGLWSTNNNVPGILFHKLTKCEPMNDSVLTFTFSYNDKNDKNRFREEISLDLWPCGNVSYRYAWGLPGGEFSDRSWAKLKSVKYISDKRPDSIKHWALMVEPERAPYPGSTECFGLDSPFGRKTGLTQLGVHHEVLKPGRRTSWPHAESLEDEWVFVIEGYPQVWLSGEVYDLVPGDFVAFPHGTGVGHTVMNNSSEDVRLLVGGAANNDANKCIYFHSDKRNTEIGDFLWRNAPVQKLGPHDGRPNKLRD